MTVLAQSRALWLLIVVSLLCSCSKKPATVVLASWIDIVNAKVNCKMGSNSGNPCTSQPVNEVLAFEAQIASDFKIIPNCHGVVLMIYKGNNGLKGKEKEAFNDADQQLVLDFDVGKKSQRWRLGAFIDKGDEPITGEGNPHEIAQAVCAAVKQNGGEVVK